MLYEVITRDLGLKMTLEKFDGMELKSKLSAEMMIWDSINQKWILQNYYIRNFEDGREELISGLRLDTRNNFV